MKIIVEYDNQAGKWDAWCDDRPDARYTGGSAVTALRRILQSNVTGGADWTSLEVDPTSSTRQRHVYTIKTALVRPCPDCGGTGRYIGLIVIEPCHACAGTGIISA